MSDFTFYPAQTLLDKCQVENPDAVNQLREWINFLTIPGATIGDYDGDLWHMPGSMVGTKETYWAEVLATTIWRSEVPAWVEGYPNPVFEEYLQSISKPEKTSPNYGEI